MKVLLGIDGSQSSEATLQALVAMARPQETEVRILHVVELWPVHVHSSEWDRELSVPRRATWTRAEETVARAARTLENAGFSVTTAVKEGDPRKELIDAASEWHADLIMVGSHGRTGLDRLLMGSVSEAVARHAPCSVQIVRISPAPTHLSVDPNEMSEDVGVRPGKTRTPTATEAKGRKRVCNICGKPSEDKICPTCADKIRAGAVARKKREDKGEE
jgi:nucleotide-binding universal stress UspA family protein